MTTDAAFERAQKVAVTAMSTDEWKDDVRKEDVTKVKHVRQLTRITKLGMIVESMQAGRKFSYTSTEGEKSGLERAFCVGFVSAHMAENLIGQMTRTDKYVAKMIIDEGSWPPRHGSIAVTFMGGKEEAWAHIVGHPNLRKCNYGRSIYVEPETEQRARARAAIGPYLESPVPDSAVCLVCVDLKWGRRADGPNGLFTQLENALSLCGAD